MSTSGISVAWPAGLLVLKARGDSVMTSSLTVAGPAVPPSTSGRAVFGGRVSLLAGAAVSEPTSDNVVSGGRVSSLPTAGPVVPDPDWGGSVASW